MNDNSQTISEQPTLLCQLAEKYGTDKGPSIHNYTPHYHERFFDRRFRVKRIFELGICGPPEVPSKIVGASLRMWRDYFPTADIVGVDYNPRWLFNDQLRINTFWADETKPETMYGPLRSTGGQYDLIIDDAIHDPKEQLLALETMIQFLAPNGVYAMEDVCPWKLPTGSVHDIIGDLPDGFKCDVYDSAHKGEHLLLITRS